MARAARAAAAVEHLVALERAVVLDCAQVSVAFEQTALPCSATPSVTRTRKAKNLEALTNIAFAHNALDGGVDGIVRLQAG